MTDEERFIQYAKIIMGFVAFAAFGTMLVKIIMQLQVILDLLTSIK